MKKAIVVIPVFKSIPDESELISYKQCLKILGKYPIMLIVPKGLDTSYYERLHDELVIEEFDSTFFQSTRTYNQLLLSKAFYRRFESYTYMLIHQLDAYVFRDELKQWCDKGYDYIGAPVHKFRLDKFTEPIPIATLNGGFSLRKIQSALRVLSSFRFIYTFSDIWRANVKEYGKIVGSLKALKYYFLGNNTYKTFNKYDRNEDLFWAVIAPHKISWFKVAPVNESLYFGFDNKPEKSFEMANGHLPFGCHSFEKHRYFWKDHISFSSHEEN